MARVAYDKMVTERQGLEAFYPDGSFELTFLKVKTPRVPERLHEQLVQTVKLLKQPAVEPREPKSTSLKLDLEQVAQNLEPCIPDLRAAIGDIWQEHRVLSRFVGDVSR